MAALTVEPAYASLLVERSFLSSPYQSSPLKGPVSRVTNVPLPYGRVTNVPLPYGRVTNVPLPYGRVTNVPLLLVESLTYLTLASGVQDSIASS